MPEAKCPVCTQSQGRRDCLLNEGSMICSLCCAKIRSEEICSACRHFENVQLHASKKLELKNEIPDIIEWNPDLEEAIDQDPKSVHQYCLTKLAGFRQRQGLRHIHIERAQ